MCIRWIGNIKGLTICLIINKKACVYDLSHMNFFHNWQPAVSDINLSYTHNICDSVTQKIGIGFVLILVN